MQKKFLIASIIPFLVFGCGDNGKNNSETKSYNNFQNSTKEEKIPVEPIDSKNSEISIKTYDGPLGLAMGISLDELHGKIASAKSIESQPGFYSITPPKSPPGFGEFYAVATKEDGICKIVAISDVNVVNDTGDQIKSRVNEIAEMIELKYGKPHKKYDFARQDVYERNPQFFMLALKEDAVTYGFDWISKKNNTTLPHDLLEINVFAAASEMSKGWARLDYVFNNFKSCSENIKKNKSQNL